MRTESPSNVSSQPQGLGQETKSTALGPERQGKVCCSLAHNPTVSRRQVQGPLGGRFQGLPSGYDHHQLETVCAQSYLTLCDPVDCSPPGSSVHGIFQVRILEWVAVLSSRGSSRPRDQTRIFCSSCIAGRFFTTEPQGRPPFAVREVQKPRSDRH